MVDVSCFGHNLSVHSDDNNLPFTTAMNNRGPIRPKKDREGAS
ncbi:MAG: hypothetical protein ACI97A_002811 [Planctomycetota bacterium]|jgi:hypothetical protein